MYTYNPSSEMINKYDLMDGPSIINADEAGKALLAKDHRDTK